MKSNVHMRLPRYSKIDGPIVRAGRSVQGIAHKDAAANWSFGRAMVRLIFTRGDIESSTFHILEVRGSTLLSGEISPQRFKQIVHDHKAATQVLTAKYAEDFPEAWWLSFLRVRCTDKDIRNGFGKFLE